MALHSTKYAVIDVGTNSVRLLTAQVSSGRIVKGEKYLSMPRIGEGFTDGLLTEESMERACEAVAAFADQAKQWGAEHLYCFATNAVRSAANGSVFKNKVKARTGVTLEIISGETEALAGFTGASGDEADTLVLDIGGGSTELIRGQNGRIEDSFSYEMGAVRMLNLFGDYSPSRYEEYKACIGQVLGSLNRFTLQGKPRLVGVAGTATTLAAIQMEMDTYCPERIQGFPLTIEQVRALLTRLGTMDKFSRRQVVGLAPQRADIICYGVCILQYVMEQTGLTTLAVSDRDNLEGYLMLRLSGYQHK